MNVNVDICTCQHPDMITMAIYKNGKGVGKSRFMASRGVWLNTALSPGGEIHIDFWVAIFIPCFF